MAEEFKELDVPFTVADTEGSVLIRYDGETLTLEYSQYKRPNQRIVFKNARAFTWQDWGNLPDGVIPDRIYSVGGSPLLSSYTQFRVGGAPYRHYKLGFNAEGKFLDVVATAMIYESPNQTPEPTS